MIGRILADPELSPGERQPATPDGWKLVPLEPTEEMHTAAVRTIVRCNGNDDFPPRVWRAMLAATPSLEAQAPMPTSEIALFEAWRGSQDDAFAVGDELRARDWRVWQGARSLANPAAPSLLLARDSQDESGGAYALANAQMLDALQAVLLAPLFSALDAATQNAVRAAIVKAGDGETR